MRFLSEHFMLIIITAGVLIFVIKLVSLLKRAKRIDQNGIETDAVVSRVEKDLETDTSGSSFYTYVQYKDERGNVRESCMSMSSDMQFEVGDRIRIKFIPGEYDMVREAKEDGVNL